MKLDVKCEAVVSIDISYGEAFKTLVKTLDMDFILKDEDLRFYNNDDGELCIYKRVDGHDELYDDRGELYKALMQVANCIF